MYVCIRKITWQYGLSAESVCIRNNIVIWIDVEYACALGKWRHGLGAFPYHCRQFLQFLMHDLCCILLRREEETVVGSTDPKGDHHIST